MEDKTIIASVFLCIFILFFFVFWIAKYIGQLFSQETKSRNSWSKGLFRSVNSTKRNIFWSKSFFLCFIPKYLNILESFRIFAFVKSAD